MIEDLLDSIARPAAYRRFFDEKTSRTTAYVAFLSLIFVAAAAVSIKLRLTHLFNETFEWLQTEVPPINSKMPRPLAPQRPPYACSIRASKTSRS
jgi:hypothetical protein